jgi:CHAT domain-containing protein/tetratricopeptide (TPR) repeat protein
MVGQGRNVDAISHAGDALATKGLSDPTRVRALMTLGLARCRSAAAATSFEDAGHDLAEAARLAQKVPSQELVGEVALRQGTCRLLRGDYDAATADFHRVLELAHREKLQFLEVNAAGSLGVVAARMRHYDEATDWLRRSQELGTRVGARVPAIKTLVNLGWCYFKLGDYDRATSVLIKAESMAAELGMTRERLIALINIGNTLYRLGDAEAAAARYRQALVLTKELGDKANMVALLGNLGTLALEQKRYDEAWSLTQEALQLNLGDPSDLRQARLVQGEVSAHRGDLTSAEGILRELIDAARDDPEDLWAARAALAETYLRANRPGAADAEFRRALAVMEQMRSSLREADYRITFFSSLRRFHDAYVRFLLEGGHVKEGFEVADESRGRLLRERLRPGKDGGVASSRRLAALRDMVLLAYWTGPKSSFLWVVTEEKVELHTLPDAATLRRAVDVHHAAVLHSQDPLTDELPEAQRLWNAVVAPAAQRIRPGARVILIPDGPLHQLNFETLVVPGPKPHYWIEDVTLLTAPSLSLLDTLTQSRPATNPTLLVIGNPVPPSEEFPRLAYAKEEVANVAALFEPAGRTILTGAQAEPTAYQRADPGRFDVIHFAAHATANRESPLDSAVVLSARDHAYKLYARDIVEVPLRAELVTLSACHSAGSRAYAGEGLVGLAWAFLSTGAGNVIGGLWNVEDESTSELMEHLYRGLREGLDPAAALRAAKLRLLRSGTVYRKPFYWAPFVIYTRRPAAGR